MSETPYVSGWTSHSGYSESYPPQYQHSHQASDSEGQYAKGYEQDDEKENESPSEEDSDDEEDDEHDREVEESKVQEQQDDGSDSDDSSVGGYPEWDSDDANMGVGPLHRWEMEVSYNEIDPDDIEDAMMEVAGGDYNIDWGETGANIQSSHYFALTLTNYRRPTKRWASRIIYYD